MLCSITSSFECTNLRLALEAIRSDTSGRFAKWWIYNRKIDRIFSQFNDLEGYPDSCMVFVRENPTKNG